MRRDSTPDSNGRLSDKRKQEILELLYDEMDRLHGKRQSIITRILGFAWRGVAVLFVTICAAWLLMPSRSFFRKSNYVSAHATAAGTLNTKVDVPEREKLDLELYEAGRRLEKSLSDIADLIDWDLTGF